MNKKYKLDAYEQDIEDNFEKQISFKDKIDKIQKAAAAHLKNKRSVTIKLAADDIEAIKIKASKRGVPYHTYLSALIHSDAIKL